MVTSLHATTLRFLSLVVLLVLGMTLGCASTDAQPIRPAPKSPGAGVSPMVPRAPVNPPTDPHAFLPKPK